MDPNRKVTAENLTAAVVFAGYGPRWAVLSQWLKSVYENKPVAVAATAEDEVIERPFYAIFCNDYDMRISRFGEYQRFYEMEKRIAPNTRGSAIGHGVVMDCAGYPEATNPQRRLKIRNAPKILLTNARYDPATVYDWALRVHNQTRDTTVLVTYDGWGHGVYDRSQCTRAINDRYLVDLMVPKSGTHCPAVEPGVQSAAGERAPVGPFAPIR